MKNQTSNAVNISAILEAMPNALIMVDKNNRVVLVNRQTEKLFGYKRDELLGKLADMLVPKRFRKTSKDVCNRYFYNPRMQSVKSTLELTGLSKRAIEFPIEISLSPLKTKEGIFSLATIRDISTRKKIEDARGILSAIVEHSNDAIIGKDLNGIIFSWNKAAENLYGYSEKEAIGKSISLIFPPKHKAELKKFLSQIRQNVSIVHEVTERMHKSKRILPVSITISPIKNAQNIIIGASSIARDISLEKNLEEQLRKKNETLEQKNILIKSDVSALEKAEKQLSKWALQDSLTNLYNRNSFVGYLPKAIERAKRNKKYMALFYIDLDNFKQVNDRLGHDAGDGLLKAVADRLKNNIRAVDLLARLGGDEFAIISEDIESTDELALMAKKYVNLLESPFDIHGHAISITLSLGIAIYPSGGKTPDELLKHADAAMYRAKESGRNNFSFFNEILNKQVERRNLLEAEMHKALQNNEFQLAYQPQFLSKDTSLVGVEVLLRWPNKALGNPKPSEFMPIAELSQLIILMGEWMIKQAMTDYKILIKKLRNKNLILSVNISAIQLTHTHFLNNLKSVLDYFKVDQSNLVFELTETSLMHNVETAKSVIEYLSKQKIRFALDDFGTGYSGMKYLKYLPISILKIDQNFISGIGQDKNDMAIIRAIISLADSLNLTTIAEGVEKKFQHNYLKQYGCQQMQGYYYAKPMSLKKLIIFAQKYSKQNHEE